VRGERRARLRRQAPQGVVHPRDRAQAEEKELRLKIVRRQRGNGGEHRVVRRSGGRHVVGHEGGGAQGDRELDNALGPPLRRQPRRCQLRRRRPRRALGGGEDGVNLARRCRRGRQRRGEPRGRPEDGEVVVIRPVGVPGKLPPQPQDDEVQLGRVQQRAQGVSLLGAALDQ